MLLKIPYKSQESICTGVFLLKKRMQPKCFLVSFAKILQNTFVTEQLRTIAFAEALKYLPK